MKKRLTIAAGVIWKENQILISQRKAYAHLGSYWEFPGGKRKEGETLEDCVIREVKEEVGIDICVEYLLDQTHFDYPEKSLSLHFFKCRWIRDKAQVFLAHHVKWVAPETLHEYTFPPANQNVLKRIMACTFLK